LIEIRFEGAFKTRLKANSRHHFTHQPSPLTLFGFCCGLLTGGCALLRPEIGMGA